MARSGTSCAALRRSREVLDVLPFRRLTEARAPIMVINTRGRRVTPLHWNEACDWKACGDLPPARAGPPPDPEVLPGALTHR
jgi:hypothetical protein